ncbi:hypothetical protein P9112_011266 [Eukaryota sp. TZLM1-RC]
MNPHSNDNSPEVACDLSTDFHSLSTDEALHHFAVTKSEGLSSSKVESQQARHGSNELTMGKQKSKLVIFLLQFHQPLIYILLVAGVVTAFLDPPDSIAIFGVVLVNSIVGFIQEVKAAQAISALAKKMVSLVMVQRNSQKIEVNATELVPGDIVYLTAGAKVPADLRLLEIHDLYIDESALTGESVPSSKFVKSVDPKCALGDRKNMAFSSTIITRGSGVGVVTSIGDYTEIGKINDLIQQSTAIKTPLTEKIERFAHALMFAIILLSIGTFFLAMFRANMEWIDSFHASVAVAVSAIPEGLPAALTITLAIGVWRMAKRNAIIRVLPAVETLGSTSVICSDKTGTLTTNQMTVKSIFVAGRTHNVSGIGYSANGEVEDINPNVISLLETGSYCNDSAIIKDGDNLKCTGDPTEGCLLVAAQKAGIKAHELANAERIAAIPFDSDLMFMATLNTAKEGGFKLHVKGALSVLEQRCSHILTSEGIREITNEDLEALQLEADKAARQGLRVLAHCNKEYAEAVDQLTPEDVQGLTLLGFQALYDPPRESVIQSIADCRGAKIQVKMLTGDHSVTALSIAKEIGLTHKDDTNVVTGPQLEELTAEQLSEIVKTTHVFARVSPENKLQIVKALHGHQEVCAVTGDGTNDAPALKAADIGVAMGTGTDVAKEAADMVLTDDNFSTIVNAVKEGRSVFANLVKFILWTIPTNASECSVIILALIWGQDIPLLPIHVLYINMVTALCLGLMLAFEPPERKIMKRSPRQRNAPLFNRTMTTRTLLVTAYLTASAFLVYEYALEEYGRAAANTAVVTTFVMVETFYLFDCRSLNSSMFAVGVFKNKMVLVGISAQMLIHIAVLYIPLMNTLFSTEPVDFTLWLIPIIAGFGVNILVALHKAYARCTQAKI